jgi:cardiolipin hydrolase
MEYKIAFSPGSDCKKLILDTIREATHKLDVCVFTISDDTISDALKAAFDRGIEIRILTDNLKVSDEGSDIEYLYNSGIDIRIDRSENHMHHKFMVADCLVTITGSYNWTRSAEKYNQENVIWINDEQFSSSFLSEFEALWSNSSELHSY